MMDVLPVTVTVTKEVKPILMNEDALEGIDYHNHRKDNNTTPQAVLTTKFAFVATTAQTTSSRTISEDNVDQNHTDDNNDDHDDHDDDDTIMTEQPSGIEKSEGPIPTTTTQVSSATTKPKRCMRRRDDHVEERSVSLPNSGHPNHTNEESLPPSPPHFVEESTTTAASSEVTLPTPPRKSRVTFTHVTIRDYPRSIGDNPASTSGASISIGWKHEAECTIALDEFEENRAPRRLGREMIIPAQIREGLLRQEGYSRAEIMQCMRELNVIRGQRRRTYETLHLQSLQLLTERMSRKAWNVLTLGEYKRKEQATYQELTRRSERPPAVTKTATSSSTTTTCPGDDESSSSYI